MLKKLFKIKQHPCIALAIKHNCLECYVITNDYTRKIECDAYVENFILYNMYQVIHDIKKYCDIYKIHNPEIVISIEAYHELLCDSIYVLQDYESYAQQAVVLPTCYKIFASFLKHEVVFQYQLFSGLLGFNISALTTDTALYLQLLKHNNYEPPSSCQTIEDLHQWINMTLMTCFPEDQINSIFIKGISLLGASNGSR